MSRLKDKTFFILILLSCLLTVVILAQKANQEIYFVLGLDLLLVIFILLRKNLILKKEIPLSLKIEKVSEKINLLKISNVDLYNFNESIKERISNYESLGKVQEDLSSVNTVEEIVSIITDAGYSLLAKSKARCLLYLVSQKDQRLLLAKSKPGENNSRNCYTADLFNEWVMVKMAPLLVTNIEDDFRFDKDKISNAGSFSSLISAPLMRENRFLGIIRLDSRENNFYSQEDLRLLDALADLSTISLENAILFTEMERLSLQDGLTGLYLRRYTDIILEGCFAKGKANKENFSVVMIDIDNFKRCNDHFGHIAGDMVLKNISMWLKETFSEKGFVLGRFGGDEFIIVGCGYNKKTIDNLLFEAREKINMQSLMLRNQEIKMDISFGVSEYNKQFESVQELIALADKRLYTMKKMKK
ncbi:MAG: sensor domain-containing diguanylate cyclase [Candidatus Gygaella obscura]|nr:sensor domain-containing diguanylate cyclase [Candidatus Gygaella obscura]